MPVGLALTRNAQRRRASAMMIACAVAALLGGMVLLIADPRVITGAAFGLIMVSIAAIDARDYVIPDRLTFAAFVLGCLYPFTDMPAENGWSVVEAALRGGVVAAAFWLVLIVYRRVRGRDGMGVGDVKLAAVSGIWLDWPTIPLAIEIAALAGLASYLVIAVARRKSIQLTSKLPFGLFFAPAIWISWILQSMTE
jgi:leader peptidase (prepilin peptidase) / N-methyltransferase